MKGNPSSRYGVTESTNYINEVTAVTPVTLHTSTHERVGAQSLMCVCAPVCACATHHTLHRSYRYRINNILLYKGFKGHICGNGCGNGGSALVTRPRVAA
jgi:hypothetical protein